MKQASRQAIVAKNRLSQAQQPTCKKPMEKMVKALEPEVVNLTVIQVCHLQIFFRLLVALAPWIVKLLEMAAVPARDIPS